MRIGHELEAEMKLVYIDQPSANRFVDVLEVVGTPCRKLRQHQVVDCHAPSHDGATLRRCGGHIDAYETLFPSSGRDRQLPTDGVSVGL